METPHQVLAVYLKKNHMNMTAQRRFILDHFLERGGHPSLDELYEGLAAEDSSIGRATVFRTLKLFAACGLASAVRFEDGVTRYESAWGREHHDHLVCDVCGREYEIADARISEALRRAAAEGGFRLTGHTAFLHGICSDCRKAES